MDIQEVKKLYETFRKISLVTSPEFRALKERVETVERLKEILKKEEIPEEFIMDCINRKRHEEIIHSQNKTIIIQEETLKISKNIFILSLIAVILSLISLFISLLR